jgi:monooxygenase
VTLFQEATRRCSDPFRSIPGYFQRAGDRLPRQGATAPLKLNQNYVSDLLVLRFGAVDDDVLQFSG